MLSHLRHTEQAPQSASPRASHTVSESLVLKDWAVLTVDPWVLSAIPAAWRNPSGVRSSSMPIPASPHSLVLHRCLRRISPYLQDLQADTQHNTVMLCTIYYFQVSTQVMVYLRSYSRSRLTTPHICYRSRHVTGLSLLHAGGHLVKWWAVATVYIKLILSCRCHLNAEQLFKCSLSKLERVETSSDYSMFFICSFTFTFQVL